MHIARTIEQLRAATAALNGAPLGLVPTMGALHEGHIALVRAALKAGQVVAASIFVNPTQFGPNEDFARYPRDTGADCAMLERAGCALVWLPEVETMYPPGDATVIEVGGPAVRWEGAVRPGHFRGVATVVARLFGRVGPRAAWFGEKDWQQVQVVRRMAADLAIPVEIATVPTVREADGLAMSSRNRYLDAGERVAAPAIFGELRRAAAALRAGVEPSAVLADATAVLAGQGMAADYLAMVHPETMEPLAQVEPGARLIVAVRLGGRRLIDNIEV